MIQMLFTHAMATRVDPQQDGCERYKVYEDLTVSQCSTVNQFAIAVGYK